MKGIIILPTNIIEQADINLLANYGFDFERNIKEYLHQIADEMRKAINENNQNY